MRAFCLLVVCFTVEASASSIIEWLYFIIVDARCLVILMSLSAIVIDDAYYLVMLMVMNAIA